MNPPRARVLKSLLSLAGILSFLIAAAPQAAASAEDQINTGVAVAKSWVGQIDAGQYDESYAFGCDAMHDKVPPDRWSRVLKALRDPLGSVTSRNQISHVYKPDGFEGTEGEFLVITYDTSFKKLDTAKEVVVLKWQDGKWRGAGYNAGPKSRPDDESASPPSLNNTETHTDAHVKPPPQ